jgi:hypothetical protein
MVLNVTFNNIFLLVEKTGIPGERRSYRHKQNIKLDILVKYKANIIIIIISPNVVCPRHEGRRGRDRMVVRFTMTYAISAYHH